jgi:hypothetical protein
MITTTLNRIRTHSPCASGWRKLLAHLGKTEGDDEVLPYAVIVGACGMDDALWCCQAEPQHSKEWRLFAVRCARSVQHLMKDPRSLAALDVAERHAHGTATDAELEAANAKAYDSGLFPGWEAAWDAAWVSSWGAAQFTYWAAVRAASQSAVRDALGLAAQATAWYFAHKAAEAAFKADFLQVVGETVTA